MKNLIKAPTRIDKSSETLLDLIITGDSSKILKAGTEELSISDHKIIYCIVKLHRERKSPQIRTVKNYKNLKVDELKQVVECTPWWVSNISDDMDDVWYAWEYLYNEIIKEFVTTRKAKVRTDSLPWITTEVRKKLNRRYRQLKKWQKTKDPSDHRNYKEARNQAKAALRQAESSYWQTEFEKANNSREFWKTVKKVQRKRISNRIGPIEDENGVIHTEDSAKAGIINDFFASVGSNLAKNLPEVEHQNFQFITRVTPSLGKIDVDEEYLKK